MKRKQEVEAQRGRSGKKRFQGGKSGTGYRFAMAYVRREVMAGRLSPAAGMKIFTMLRQECEMWMIEQQLNRSGVSFNETSVHIDETRDYQSKRVTVKTGRGKNGEEINEQSVTVQGGAYSDLEHGELGDAESEALGYGGEDDDDENWQF